MNDQALAEKIMALGVGVKIDDDTIMFPDDNHWMTSVTFVHDPRVAMALMEKCAKSNDPDRRTIALSFGPEMFCATAAGSATPTYGVYLERSNESAPRAINEACAALKVLE